MTELFNFFIVLVVFLVLDLPMITYINKDMYKNLFDNINNGATVDSTNIIIGAIVAYLLLAYGLYIFAIKNKSIFNGALFGLVVYGVYNFTNASLYPNKWNNYIIIGDILWGMILTSIITFSLYKLQYLMKY
jgi:uncharacterized membrane protein